MNGPEIDRVERLLRGYRLPDVPPELDRRVLREATEVLDGARAREAVEDVGRSLLDRLGFGWLAWIFDLATSSDAEYSVVVL